MMRSLLFVPGDSRRKLEKALASGADALLIDLEDSVALDAKHNARQVTAAFVAEMKTQPTARAFTCASTVSPPA